MRTMAIVVCLLLLFIAHVSADSILDKAQTDIVYARSFQTGQSSAVLKLAFPIIDGKLFKKDYSINTDVLGFLDNADIGLGGSCTIKNIVSKLSVGVGWLPKGYGVSWYVGVRM